MILDNSSSGHPSETASTFLRPSGKEAKHGEGFLPVDLPGKAKGFIRQAGESIQPGHVLGEKEVGLC